MLQSTDSDINRRRNPRKNRCSAASVRSKAKSMKKPDPNAADMSYQCTECPKVFRSEKALHGHMRLHPEREWRGIIPPLQFRRRLPVWASPYFPTENFERSSSVVTDEEQDIADCLILLSNGPNFIDRVSDFRFQCSSCKRVFGSHQALEQHTGSDKNVECCFAIAKGDEESEEEYSLFRSINLNDKVSMSLFESHQALEKHSPSHKDVKCCFAIAKSDGETEAYSLFRAINLNDKVSMISGTGLVSSSCSSVFSTRQTSAIAEHGCVNFDLNMPAPDEDGSSSSTYFFQTRLTTPVPTSSTERH